MVAAGRRPDDDGMPEPTTVWMVRLRKGEMAERKGLLTLDVEGVVFREAGSLDQVRTFRFDELRRARRVRGSPILIVTHTDDRGAVDTAFYFTEPPPLEPSEPFTLSGGTGSVGRPLNPFAAMRKTSKRRHMKDNVRYLTARSGNKKAEIQEWVDEITTRLGG